MKLRSVISFIVIIFPANTSGFLFPSPMTIKEGLVEVVDSQKVTSLSIQLDIGEDKQNAPRLNVKDINIALASKPAAYTHPLMPGANGPHPQLSSGPRTLTVTKQGHFISMAGEQTVETLNGCWEIVWRENALAGALICGFDIPEEYVRNDASLPKGRLYLSFPIWTKVGLREAREDKEKVLARSKELQEEKQEQLDKMEATGNPIMKALHLRNAYAAMEKHYMQPLSSVKMVPSDEEIVSLQDDLLLTTKGLAFTKSKTFFGTDTQILLGAAFVRSGGYNVNTE